MSKAVVIVESPSKADAFQKYLGKGYCVLASYGHMRDLASKTGAVDPDADFSMQYDPIERNAAHFKRIVTALKGADKLILATDPDREGEAIAWHVCELLLQQKKLKGITVERVVFHEITKKAILQAMETPRDIAMDLVDAQQARRALDHLVGFNLSPLLWKKVGGRLSAGRVQSPALRMIAEREIEIEAFKPQEYWTLTAQTQADKTPFSAKLYQYEQDKLEQFSITHADQANTIQKALLEQANGVLIVKKITKKPRKRNPSAPFITSTLQQEAAHKLGFPTTKTMRVAQQLYEGIDIGSGQIGLITYMRTDSVHISDDAIKQIRTFIGKQYPENHCPKEPRQYKTKAKNAQEAHEAIRPTDVNHYPDDLRSALSDEQYKLYKLIWQRTVASQMIAATFDTVSVDLGCGKLALFRANGSTLVEAGYMLAYQYDQEDPTSDSGPTTLPKLTEGEQLPLNTIDTHQHFTEPPPRYSEATLVKALEEHGIGRPSTYSNIIDTLKRREYVTLDKKRFHPTDVGCVVNKFLTAYFEQYVDYDFTANLEDELDAISRGETAWIPVLKTFWSPFKQQVDEIEKTVSRKDVTQEDLDEDCPECQHKLCVRLGKRGKFIACTHYPECKYTRNVQGDDASSDSDDAPALNRSCPLCQHDLAIKQGRYGKFIGCSNYPNCKHIEPLEKPADTGIECPTCHQGNLLKRRSRRGSYFYSCATYPDCKYAVWNPPIAETCPTCAWPILTLKTTKRSGNQKVCPQKSCTFCENLDDNPT